MDSIYNPSPDASADIGETEERKDGKGENDNFLLSKSKIFG